MVDMKPQISSSRSLPPGLQSSKRSKKLWNEWKHHLDTEFWMLVAYLYGRSSCLEVDRHTHQNCYGDPEKIKEGGGASWFHQSSDAGMFGLETSSRVCVVIDWPSALATRKSSEPSDDPPTS